MTTSSSSTDQARCVALTGGTGALGRHVLREFVRRGTKVRALRRPSCTLAEQFDPELVSWVDGDLEDPTALDTLVDGVDSIVHLAYSPLDAVPTGGRSTGEHFAASNFVGTVRLIERTAATRNRQLIFASTLAVHGKLPFTHAIDEDTATWPQEFYGAHKAALEKLVHAASFTWGLNTSIWRLGWVVCDYDSIERDPLVQPLREARDHGAILGQHAAYLIAADDAARILCDAVGDESTKGGRYHLFDRWFDWNELAEPLSELLGHPIEPKAAPAPDPNPGITRDRLSPRGARFATIEAIRARLAALVDLGA
ncbi:MAG: NAD(P)-dependent oxidoreductase [Planctomycetota bacterium]